MNDCNCPFYKPQYLTSGDWFSRRALTFYCQWMCLESWLSSTISCPFMPVFTRLCLILGLSFWWCWFIPIQVSLCEFLCPLIIIFNWECEEYWSQSPPLTVSQSCHAVTEVTESAVWLRPPLKRNLCLWLDDRGTRNNHLCTHWLLCLTDMHTACSNSASVRMSMYISLF